MEYADKQSPSIYVRFPVQDGKGIIPEENTYVVIWTTTPWTLPANLAISLHPEYEYLLLKNGDDKFLVAAELMDNFVQTVGLEAPEIIKRLKGADLERVECRHPFVDRDSRHRVSMLTLSK